MLNLPIFDLPTKSSSGFIYRYVLPRMSPPPLIGLFARNPFFSAFINNSDFVLATGHGNVDELTGQNEVSLWLAGKYNPQQTQGKVIKLLSCDTGQILCPDLVQNGGARSALGYDEDYLWIADPSFYFHPWDDQMAGLNLKPVMDGINALLSGATAIESLNIEKAGYLKNMEDADSELMFSLLKWNYDHAVLFGDENATITPARLGVPPFPPPPFLF
jgi:hypothetical protein